MASTCGNPIDVAAALLFHRGQLLITQRPEGTHLAGLWEFPGGKRMPDESFEACLHRELDEELGISVRILGLYQTVHHDYAEASVHLKFFECRWKSGDPRPIECADIAWALPETLDDYKFPAADRQLLDRLKSDSRPWSQSALGSSESTDHSAPPENLTH